MIVLNYANPRVFFVGVYRHGTWRNPLGATLLAGLGLLFIWVASNRLPALAALQIGLQVIGAITILGGGYLLWGWLAGWEEEFAITEDGIEQDQRLWSWNEIARLGGTVEGTRVKLFIYTRGGVTFYRYLATTPLLTRQEYDALIRELQTFLAERHPDVTIDLEPEVSLS